MDEKELFLAEIERLKRDKPPKWKSECKKLVRKLYGLALKNREVSWPFRQNPDGRELVGRKVLNSKTGMPLHDRYDDESDADSRPTRF